jgi:hypothetical protein
VLRCQILGHRPRFTAAGATMRWDCERGCGQGGSREYATAAEAAMYARGLNREDRDDVGRRAPLVALLPMRLFRALRGRRAPR